MAEERLFRKKGLKLNEVAERVRTTPRILSASLRVYAGQGFNEYINSYRIIHAMGLLKEPGGRRSIDRVASEVGFNGTSSFYAAFKRQWGLTPREYLKKSGQLQVRRRLGCL